MRHIRRGRYFRGAVTFGGRYEVATNNRPLSLLPTISKVCGKVALKQFAAHLSQYKLLTQHQSGKPSISLY